MVVYESAGLIDNPHCIYHPNAPFYRGHKMDTDQVILCSFVDKTNKDKPTGQVTMYNVKNGQSISPVFREVTAERGCLALLDGIILEHTSHFLSFSPAYSTFQVSCFAKEKPVAKFFGHEKLSCIASDGVLAVAGTANGSLFVWQVSSGALLKVLNKVHFQQVSALSFASEYLCSASIDGTVKVWDKTALVSGEDAEPLYSYAAHSMEVVMVKFGLVGDRKCRLFTCGSDSTVLVYDMFDGAMSAKFTFPSTCKSLAIDALEMVLAVGCEDGAVYLLDLDSTSSEILTNLIKFGHHSSESGMCLKTLDASPVTSLCFSIDNLLLIAGHADGAVRFWDARSMQLVRQVTGTGAVTNILCMLRNPINVGQRSARTFIPFKRNVDADSDLLLDTELVSTKTQNIVDQKPSIDVNQQRLQQINNELFEHILQQSEINK